MNFILLCVLGLIVGTEGEQCITPNGETGECVNIKTCKSLMAMVLNPRRTVLDNSLIRAYANVCQYTNKKHSVCCPLSGDVRPETTTKKIFVPHISESCSDGHCVNIRNCSVLLDIALDPNITEKDKKYLRDRQCKNDANGVSVCCPEPELPVTTEATIITNTVDTQHCQTPRGKSGSCVPILECNSLRILSVKSHRTYEEIELLEQSKCGDYYFSYKVCCPKQEIEKEREYKDRGILPTAKECGTYIATNRIAGGAPTDVDEYPWTALLLYENKEESSKFSSLVFGCGGSLINKHFVITAAHCKEANGLSVVGLRLGDWNIVELKDCQRINGKINRCAPPYKYIDIAEIIIHPNYNPKNLAYDVALLRLAFGVEYSEFIKPICLPFDASLRQKRYGSGQADITGWGRTEYGPYSPLKLKATVQLMKIVQKKGKHFCGKVQVSETKLCATGEDKDSCQSDSGGPLMVVEEVNENMNWYLIGIVSYGNLNNTCGAKGSIGIYARVGSFLDWIRDTIRT